jgi:hypothetical protein
MLEILIKERYYKRENKVFQHFIFDKRQGKYLRDIRLKIYREFEKRIKQKAFDELYFIQRRDETDRTVLEYEIEEGFEKPKNTYFVVAAELPSNPGCDFCKHRRDYNPPFVWCEYKQKTLSHKIKNCKFFNQKEEL